MNIKAFVVGISKYANPRNNLEGVENDVSAFVKVLSKFDIHDVEVLRDSNATSENIKKGLNNFVFGATAGDVRIFYYSGHGFLLPKDMSGTSDVDHQDEALVPYEGTSASLILDNWLALFLKNTLPSGVNLWAVYDSCHSGDMFKGALLDDGMQPVEKEFETLDLIYDGQPQRWGTRYSTDGITTKTLVLDDGIFNSFHFGAAEPSKTALVMNIGGVRRSVFTWALEQVVTKTMTVSEFEMAVTAKQKEQTDHHVPQIACAATNKNRVLFSAA